MKDKNVLRKFLLKMFEALELISDSNTVPPDLKPDNILVTTCVAKMTFIA